ncbi:MAG: hypothetical protein JW908_16380 [Anaerolineales bacterium]|nr:hypothetical protein [Anaerolineales bacterium]
MNQTNPPENNIEAKPAPVRSWQSRGRIFGIPVSLIAIWAALFVAASAVPALPVPGMGGMITVNAIMTAISGVVLGPAAAVANMAGAIIATILFPFGAFFGPISFLTATVGGLIAGLTFANRWKLAGAIELLLIASWFVNPASWQPYMYLVPLPYTGIAVLVIFIKPLREWARNQILTQNKVWMWPALFLFASIGHAGEYLTSNSMTNWMYNLTWQYWIPTLPYWIGVDTVIVVLSMVVGVGVLIGLHRARLPHASDLYIKK